MSHQHAAQHTSRTNAGTLYEVCDCGAIRVTRENYTEPWHACALCSTEFESRESLHDRIGAYGEYGRDDYNDSEEG